MKSKYVNHPVSVIQYLVINIWFSVVNQFLRLLVVSFSILRLFIGIVILISIVLISPITDSRLFNKESEGSLYQIMSLSTLLMLRHRKSNALIPIVKVFDMDIDPSGPAREFNNKAVIYMWTRKIDGKQYVGSTRNAGHCFGKRYNSPSGLLKDSSYFNYSLGTQGRANYFVTILAIVDATSIFRLPIETMWIHIMDSEFNINLIAGTNLVQRVCAWTREVGYRSSLAAAARARLATIRGVNPLQPWLGKSLFGAANPFFGVKHSQLTKDSMSSSKGTQTYIYSIDLDMILTPVGCYTSSNRATSALKKLGILISRPTLVNYTKLFDTNPRLTDHIFTCKNSGQRFIFTTFPQKW